MNNKERGNLGEEKASQYLLSKGYEILARNWRTKYGEIDIICKKADVLVFVEVKTLPNATPDMLCAVLNKKKCERILKTSKRFLINNRQYSNSYIRYDVIVFDMPGLPSVYHIENAFMENL
ncbi:MAG: YraN family protein [Treponema sp.]|nr:YraN family protein [Treponema sp.]